MVDLDAIERRRLASVGLLKQAVTPGADLPDLDEWALTSGQQHLDDMTVLLDEVRRLQKRLDHAYETIDTFAGERDAATARALKAEQRLAEARDELAAAGEEVVEFLCYPAPGSGEPCTRTLPQALREALKETYRQGAAHGEQRMRQARAEGDPEMVQALARAKAAEEATRRAREDEGRALGVAQEARKRLDSIRVALGLRPWMDEGSLSSIIACFLDEPETAPLRAIARLHRLLDKLNAECEARWRRLGTEARKVGVAHSRRTSVKERAVDWLKSIHIRAHELSTGPTVPDGYWELRAVAAEAMDDIAQPDEEEAVSRG